MRRPYVSFYRIRSGAFCHALDFFTSSQLRGCQSLRAGPAVRAGVAISGAPQSGARFMPLLRAKGQRHGIAEPVPSQARNLLRSSIFLPIGRQAGQPKGRLSGLPMGKKTAMTLCAAA